MWYTSSVVTRALDLPPDMLGNLRALGHLTAGTRHGKSVYYSRPEVLALAIALRLARLLGQRLAFELAFDPDFGDELLAAIGNGTPLVLVHAQPPYLTWRDAGEVAMTTADSVTQVRIAEPCRELLARLETASREAPRAPIERRERHDAVVRRHRVVRPAEARRRRA